MKERQKLIATAKAFITAPGIPTGVRLVIEKLVYELEHSVPIYEGR